jgi:zinc transport system ATP-binding protein
MTNALEVGNLTVRIGAREVLRDLNFVLADCSCLAVIGPNGVGKTVLLRALIGALPSRGSIRWKPGARLGLVPQKLDIERDLPLSGADLMRAKAALSGAGPADVARALQTVGLSEALTAQPIGAMSGGQFQRLLMAAALLGRPNVLLLDEPAAGVDLPGQARMNEVIHGLQRDAGMSVILISHDLSVVNRYADAVLCLGGEQVFFGPPQAVLTAERLGELYGAPIRFHVHEHGHG